MPKTRPISRIYLGSFGELVDYLPAGLAFVMPISRILSAIMIGIWFIAVAISGKIEIDKRRIIILLPTFLWFIQLISGIFFAKDLFRIGLDSKASLAVLPLIFFLSGAIINKKTINRALNGLVLGTMVALLYSFFPGLFLTIKSGNVTFDVYRYFASRNIHHTYIALYFCLSFFLYLWKDKIGFLPLIKLRWLLFLFLLLFMSLLSRAGLIMIFIIMVFRIIAPQKGLRISNYFLIGLIISLIIFGLFTQGRLFNDRFFAVLEKIDIRITLWKILFTEGFNKLVTGVGVGNLKPIIYHGLINMKLPELAQIHYNAHNQFLQYLTELGLVGLCIYFMVLFVPFFNESVRENQLFMVFIFIVLISSSFESILERQFGTMFFSYYYCLLIFFGKIQEKHHRTTSFVTIEKDS